MSNASLLLLATKLTCQKWFGSGPAQNLRVKTRRFLAAAFSSDPVSHKTQPLIRSDPVTPTGESHTSD